MFSFLGQAHQKTRLKPGFLSSSVDDLLRILLTWLLVALLATLTRLLRLLARFLIVSALAGLLILLALLAALLAALVLLSTLVRIAGSRYPAIVT